jgi:hypothetical protein
MSALDIPVHVIVALAILRREKTARLAGITVVENLLTELEKHIAVVEDCVEEAWNRKVPTTILGKIAALVIEEYLRSLGKQHETLKNLGGVMYVERRG